MAYTNSSLICYTKISPNRTSPRNHTIDTITIHCMAGDYSIEKCGDIFAPTSRKASSNYGIGTDGRIALYCPESDRSWCSSSSTNDNRAITIEVANNGGVPDWSVSDKALQSLIKLCADICKRNNIKKLVYSIDKSTRVNHLNGANMTLHRDFAAKACPGNYLVSKHPYIADEVNKILGSQDVIVSTYKTNTVTSCTATIKGVQQYLNKYYGTYIKSVLGSTLTEDGSFGEKSKKGLAIAYQVEINAKGGSLKIDGSFGPGTEKAFNTYVGSIKTGSKGIFVTLWQCLLVGFGYDPRGIDGSYGSGCKAATNQLFKDKSLPQDYVVDGSDLNKLL